jgi:MoaA/NifB/PqqE/SkfB family radical SAM enzyme
VIVLQEEFISTDKHTITNLPMLVLMPHSGCNCRCVMCDIWKANRDNRELSEQDLAAHLEDLRRLGVRMVTLSGGEALMSANLFTLCRLLRKLDVTISLMSTGLLLHKYAAEVIQWCDAVTVSLDGGKDLHDAIRRVPHAFDRLAEGVAAVKALRPSMPVVGRCVVQRSNFRDIPYVIHAAKAVGLDMLSFLPADVTSEAFNRPQPWGVERSSEIALGQEETSELARIVEEIIARYGAEISSGFIYESCNALRRLVQYYAALNGASAFPRVICNAPWVSAVIEADQTVRPCYFQPAIGNIRNQPLLAVLNSDKALAFRRNLDMDRDPICQRCVCPMYLPYQAG